MRYAQLRHFCRENLWLNARIDSFWGFSGFIDSPTSYATLITLPCLSLIWISKSYQCIAISHWSRGLTNERNETVVLNRCFHFSHWSRRKWLLNSIAIRREIGVSSFLWHVLCTDDSDSKKKTKVVFLWFYTSLFETKALEYEKIIPPSLFLARQVPQPTCYCSLPQASKWGGKNVYPLPTVV